MRYCIMAGVLMGAALAAAPASLHAQPRLFGEDGNLWIGYAANAPNQLLGGGAAFLLPHLGGIGLYADVKFPHNSPEREPFRRDLTPDQAADFGDFHFGNRSAWNSVNGAVVKALGPEFAVYLGAGVAERRVYLRYTDDTLERHEEGFYWVHDEAQAATHVNGLAGMFFRLGPRFIFQMGAETAPAGFTAGMHIVLR